MELVSAVECAEKPAGNGEQQSKRETAKKQRAHRGRGRETGATEMGRVQGPRLSYVAARASATTPKLLSAGRRLVSHRTPRERLC